MSKLILEVTNDEAALLDSGRCDCGHLYALHNSHCCSFCEVDGCWCGDDEHSDRVLPPCAECGWPIHERDIRVYDYGPNHGKATGVRAVHAHGPVKTLGNGGS